MHSIRELKRILLGNPIPTKLAHNERLPVIAALPIFASDALSSTAYAGEEILLKLQMGGSEQFKYLVPIVCALLALLWVVIFSYYQTIHAYPRGGGSYRVASENLGRFSGLVAAGALLIGYVLTVAVSVSAGSQAVVAMLPQTQPYAVWMACAAVLLITYVNLRGAKESAVVFALPTYSFVLLVAGVAATGAYMHFFKGVPQQVPVQIEPIDTYSQLAGAALIFFVFKAFAAGCTALTGTEAIADGVLAFKAPEAKNASRTLVAMGVTLSILLFGSNWAFFHYGITPMHVGEPGYKTALAQLAATLFGDGSGLFYATQVATAVILVLAANTGYVDFPRLSMFVARDGFLPRQLSTLGDRLVFQNGIISLGALSIALIIGFNADTHQLIPMYAVGVFLSFTLSQAGMVLYFVKRRIGGFKRYISGLGMVVTGVVTLVLLITRWSEGAWLTVAALSVVIIAFYAIKSHYMWLAGRLNVTADDRIQDAQTTVLLLVPRLHKGILQAISYSRALSDDVRAIHVTLDPESAKTVKRQWIEYGADMPLVILESPYRSLVQPITDYVDETIREHEDDDCPNHMITVIVPQAVPKNFLQTLLHNNIAFALKRALKARKNVVIANVRYFLDDR